MKNKQLTTYDIYKKIRKTWNRSPVTKIKKSKKLYNRQLSKKDIDRIRKEEEF